MGKKGCTGDRKAKVKVESMKLPRRVKLGYKCWSYSNWTILRFPLLIKTFGHIIWWDRDIIPLPVTNNRLDRVITMFSLSIAARALIFHCCGLKIQLWCGPVPACDIAEGGGAYLGRSLPGTGVAGGAGPPTFPCPSLHAQFGRPLAPPSQLAVK